MIIMVSFILGFWRVWEILWDGICGISISLGWKILVLWVEWLNGCGGLEI
jgi:hypothetical protein